MNKLALVSRIRLLPVVIAIAILAFGLKVGYLWNHSPFVLGGAKPAEAQQAANEAEPAEKAAGDDVNVNADGEESAATPALARNRATKAMLHDACASWRDVAAAARTIEITGAPRSSSISCRAAPRVRLALR